MTIFWRTFINIKYSIIGSKLLCREIFFCGDDQIQQQFVHSIWEIRTSFGHHQNGFQIGINYSFFETSEFFVWERFVFR